MKKTLLALTLLTVTYPCHAIDGETLKTWCHQSVEKSPGSDLATFRDGYCMGMTEGVMALAGQRSLMAFCAPEPTSKTMLLRTVLSFLDAHPERLKASAEVLILEALGEAYPCQQITPGATVGPSD